MSSFRAQKVPSFNLSKREIKDQVVTSLVVTVEHTSHSTNNELHYTVAEPSAAPRLLPITLFFLIKGVVYNMAQWGGWKAVLGTNGRAVCKSKDVIVLYSCVS